MCSIIRNSLSHWKYEKWQQFTIFWHMDITFWQVLQEINFYIFMFSIWWTDGARSRNRLWSLKKNSSQQQEKWYLFSMNTKKINIKKKLKYWSIKNLCCWLQIFIRNYFNVGVNRKESYKFNEQIAKSSWFQKLLKTHNDSRNC